MANRNRSRSRDEKRNDRRTRSQINVVDSKNPRNSKRSRKRREQLKRKYRRRRIALALVLIAIIVLIVRMISNALNSYDKMGYPAFRDEVLTTMGEEVFVSSSEGRSLSTAEKVTDFDDFFTTIQRNYAVDDYNREDFEEFINQYNDYRKKVYTSKTDQEYFNILDQYLEVLDDSRTFILDKETYDSLFNYYRNQKSDYRREVLENPQAVDRYKRLIQQASLSKPSLKIDIDNGYILRLTLADFKADEFDEDKKRIVDTMVNNPPTTTVLLDLRDNNSIDYIYRNKLLELLIHDNYTGSALTFYRGNIYKQMLDGVKASENSYFSSAVVANDASKYAGEELAINLDDYMYYDELSLNIPKDLDFSNRNIYVLTNQDTANEAIKMAEILKASGAYVVKNALDPNPTYKDVIYNAPADLYILEHSGLVMSLNGSFSKNNENLYLDYNEKINSRDPVSTMLNIIN